MTEEKTDLALACRVLSEAEERLIVQAARTEHVVVLIFLVLGTAVFGPMLCYGIYAEARQPGTLGQDLVLEELGIHEPASGSRLYRVLAVGGSWLFLLFFAVMVLFCCRKLYRRLAYGRARMVLDRAQDSVTFAKEQICPLSTVTHVVVTQGEVDGDDRYCVDLASEDPLRRMQDVRSALREDLLSFPRRADAERFARRIAAFLHVEVVTASGEDAHAPR